MTSSAEADERTISLGTDEKKDKNFLEAGNFKRVLPFSWKPLILLNQANATPIT